MNIDTICHQLQSLAQPTRLKIFRCLIQAPATGICAGELCKQLGVSCSALSFHLNHLSHAGLISSTKRGRFIIYKANHQTAKKLTQYLLKNCCNSHCDQTG